MRQLRRCSDEATHVQGEALTSLQTGKNEDQNGKLKRGYKLQANAENKHYTFGSSKGKQVGLK
ncbi:MAG: hypothetical protein IT269_03855 [Saprospiraceae bacterium]|nr:hypothetical protein [Saprospiraceae bacterium]